MVDIWNDILGVEAVSPTDNFFMLGGDSLKAAALMAHIEEACGVQLDAIEIFEHPVLADFVVRLVAAADGPRGVIEEGIL